MMKKQVLLILIIAFSVIRSDSQTLTSPNGGENWVAGSVHQIVFTGSVSAIIKYSVNNGVSWSSVVPISLSPYSWTIPNTPSAQCLVKISWCGSCVDSSNAFFTISSGTGSGVDEKKGEQNNLNIYPNPCNSVLNVGLSSAAHYNKQIEIVNLLGNVVLVNEAINNLGSIDVSKLPAGIYFLNYLYDNKKITKKFVKE